MFENLTDKLNLAFKKLKGHGKLTEKNIDAGLKEIRMALLEADVHYKVVKDLVAAIRERAIGQEVLASLTPGQQVVKIVNEELTQLMGSTHEGLRLTGSRPAVVMLVGLQGSGKTTTAGKLAKFMMGQHRRPYLVPADPYRPAAIDQLKKIGNQVGAEVFPATQDMDPVDICRDALQMARQAGFDTLVIDTAGRLHVDEALMAELGRIKETVHPSDILLVADAMTGQDAVNIAKAFHDALDIGGVILTKMEGDARGGAAISIKAITSAPIKFVGVGEKLDALEPFHPDRMASRILGMGDILSLIEKAQESIDEKRALELEKKLRKSQFTLEDFRDQMVQIRKMGSLEDLLAMIPGMGKLKQLKQLKVDERELVRITAIIDSMTAQERRNHNIINASRRKRIAKGSGTTVQEVNQLLKNYVQVHKMIKKLNKGGFGSLGRGMLPF
ncbi:MAG: signal recognition particle protein [Deltaproteobacteria bacterium]|nr:signal recognition particle protein [Deltaproteobacteria bacterium]MBW2018971.1 signal recognition particle protein [Deltaproteobacteria bacterium]MBW2073561.1 signal recognition particle protein [Deltaproteobacteria bacterium]RLB82725.1 MAG: signal recognition particle protein [Deltaproteobacteria bacterium]